MKNRRLNLSPKSPREVTITRLANGMRADLEGLVFVSGLRCPMFGRRIEVVK